MQSLFCVMIYVKRGGDVMVTTSSLVEQLIKSKNFQEVIDRNAEAFEEQPISEYLSKLCKERGLVAEHVIIKSQIDRTYGHQIFNGTRVPSRDKLIQIALGMELSLDETQLMLITANKGILYVKCKRDAAIIFGITHKFSVMELQELLESAGLPLLGGL